MEYKKRFKKKMNRQLRKFIKYGLIIAFVALMLLLLLDFFNDLQANIVGLQQQVTQQNIHIDGLKEQLQTSLDTNTQLKLKINGMEEIILQQNEIIHDLKEEVNQPVPVQPQVSEGYSIEKEVEIETPAPDFKKFVNDPVILIPVAITALEIGRRLIMPVRSLLGGF